MRRPGQDTSHINQRRRHRSGLIPRAASTNHVGPTSETLVGEGENIPAPPSLSLARPPLGAASGHTAKRFADPGYCKTHCFPSSSRTNITSSATKARPQGTLTQKTRRARPDTPREVCSTPTPLFFRHSPRRQASIIDRSANDSGTTRYSARREPDSRIVPAGDGGSRGKVPGLFF